MLTQSNTGEGIVKIFPATPLVGSVNDPSILGTMNKESVSEIPKVMKESSGSTAQVYDMGVF